MYLDKNTEPRIVKVVHMIKNTKTEDLACIYKLFSRLIHDALKTIAESVSDYLRVQGQSLVTVKEDESTNLITFVQNLLDLKDHLNHCLLHSFNNDKILKNMISSNF